MSEEGKEEEATKSDSFLVVPLATALLQLAHGPGTIERLTPMLALSRRPLVFRPRENSGRLLFHTLCPNDRFFPSLFSFNCPSLAINVQGRTDRHAIRQRLAYTTYIVGTLCYNRSSGSR